MAFLRQTLAAITLLLASLPASAQQATVTAIAFTGGAPYTEKDLTTVLGLHTGQPLSDSDIQTASARLSATGLFDAIAVAATDTGDTREVRYTLKATPDARLLAPSFANFVWFTPEEIDRTLRTRVPLYRGLLPDSGNLSDSLQAVLEQMLQEKGVTATVRHSVVEPTTAHPHRVVNFRIQQPEIVLARARISGLEALPAEQQPAINGAFSRLVGKPYNEGETGVTTVEEILAPARDLGYITAKIEDLRRTVTPSAHGYDVTVTGKLIPGSIYTLAQLMWAPTPAYSAADFQYDIDQHSKETLHPGAVASQKALTYTELQVANVYHLLGYMDAYLNVIPELDTAAHTVTYKLRVIPGEQYRVHAIHLNGASDQITLDYNVSWTMYPGDLYNPLYLGSWVKSHIERHKFDGYDIRYFASTDPTTHLVDLTITFVSKRQTYERSTP